MTIAEQLTRAKTDLDAVYAAGKEAGGGGSSIAKILQYVSNAGEVNRLFYRADFQGADEIKVKMPNSPANLSELFAFAVGIQKIVLVVPTTQTYNGYRLVYGGSDMVATIEELMLPDGIKFSDFSNFARNAPKLKTISGRINLSECIEAPNPFQNCTSLEDVEFMPNSIPLSISFANSPHLSDASIQSIILGLADLRGQTTQTLTVHSTVYDKILQLRDEHETVDGKNPYDPSVKNWELVRGV